MEELSPLALCSIEDVKIFRQIDVEADDSDELTARLINVASGVIADYVHTNYGHSGDQIIEMNALAIDGTIKLNKCFVRSIDAVELDDVLIVEWEANYTDGYITSLTLTDSHINDNGLVTVHLKAGNHDGVPGAIAHACVALVAAWFVADVSAFSRQFNADAGVLVGNGDAIPRGIKQLLDPYRRRMIG